MPLAPTTQAAQRISDLLLSSFECAGCIVNILTDGDNVEKAGAEQGARGQPVCNISLPTIDRETLVPLGGKIIYNEQYRLTFKCARALTGSTALALAMRAGVVLQSQRLTTSDVGGQFTILGFEVSDYYTAHLDIGIQVEYSLTPSNVGLPYDYQDGSAPLVVQVNGNTSQLTYDPSVNQATYTQAVWQGSDGNCYNPFVNSQGVAYYDPTKPVSGPPNLFYYQIEIPPAQ